MCLLIFGMLAQKPGILYGEGDFTRWLEGFSQVAVGNGVKLDTWRNAFLGIVEPDETVLEKARYQPEFTTKIWDYLDARVHSLAIEKFHQTLAIEAGNKRQHVPPGQSGIVGIAAVDENLQFGFAVRLQLSAPTGRDDDAQSGPIAIQKVGQPADVVKASLKLKIGGGGQPGDQVPALDGVVIVHYGRGNIVHIQAQCITEK